MINVDDYKPSVSGKESPEDFHSGERAMGRQMFDEELNFFMKNQDRLVQEHKGKFLVIKGQELIGVYPSALTAYLETQKEHSLGSFMIQPCEPGPEAYTVTVTSTVLKFNDNE